MCPPEESRDDYDEDLPEDLTPELEEKLLAKRQPYHAIRYREDIPIGNEFIQWHRTCAAYHEAGHAVMALVFSQDGRTVSRVERVWLYQDGWLSSGKCLTHPVTPLANAYIALGSIMAEARYLGVSVDSVIAAHQYCGYWGPEREDWNRYQEFRKQPAPLPPSRVILADIAKRLDEPWVWTAVGDIARALVERNSLTGEEVQEMVNTARRNATQ